MIFTRCCLCKKRNQVEQHQEIRSGTRTGRDSAFAWLCSRWAQFPNCGGVALQPACPPRKMQPMMQFLTWRELTSFRTRSRAEVQAACMVIAVGMPSAFASATNVGAGSCVLLGYGVDVCHCRRRRQCHGCFACKKKACLFFWAFYTVVL